MIKLGGSTEVEVKERKDRVDDALNATRAAVEEGIVPGGGTALLRASSDLKVKGANADQQAGINIVRRALQEPSNSQQRRRRRLRCCWQDPGKPWLTFGYKAATGEYGDMIAMGIIDPVNVVRSALQDAASVAGLLITTEAMIGGMGGMDY